MNRPFHKTLPRFNAFVYWISVRFYETGCINTYVLKQDWSVTDDFGARKLVVMKNTFSIFKEITRIFLSFNKYILLQKSLKTSLHILVFKFFFLFLSFLIFPFFSFFYFPHSLCRNVRLKRRF